MNKARDIKNIALGAIVAVSGLSALAAVNLTTFTAGTPIKSSEVNANFSSLKANIEALQAPNGISGAQLAAGSVDKTKLAVSGAAADGKVLKLQAGNLAWADDLTGGSGGTAYTAGTGLSLTGTTFSLADGGVTAGKLSASGGADGKVLKLSGGNLTWADDQVGSAGTTYTADGSSLQLSGTVFSIKDGGVSSAKLANAAVTDSKIQVPLTLSGNSSVPVLSVTNATGNSISGISSGGSIGVLGRSSARGIVGTQGDLGMSCPGTYAIGGCATDGTGVQGNSASGIGVLGNSTTRGVIGTLGGTSCAGSYAVGGCAADGIGVLGRSTNSYGVYGESSVTNAVYGVTVGGNTNATAVGGTSVNGYAAYFEAGNGSGGFATCTFHAGTTNWSCSSDRNLKDHFKVVNTDQVLEAVAKMPVTTWSMKGSTIRQMGPTAQDFYAAFKLGTSDKSINNTDVQGVALAAIKGLNTKLETENVALRASLEALEMRLATLEKAVRSK
jgi:Chaperone of endosialidase